MITFIVAVITLVIAVVALVVAWHAISRSNKNSSAATLVALYEGFRQAWQRFLDAEDDAGQQYELSELMNLVELACAIDSEHSFVGVSRKLVREYLENSLLLLSNNENAGRRIPAMFTSPTTFEYIRRFLNSRHNELSKRWSSLLALPKTTTR